MKLFIATLLLISISSIQCFHSMGDREAESFLGAFYDYDKSKGNLDDSVKEMQSMAGLAPTGKLDAETRSYMNKDRCGEKDSKKKFNKRYNIANSKWDSGKTYTYFIHKFNPPRTMDWGAVRRAVMFGCEYWSKVSNIKFQEGYQNGASFSMSFAGPNHKKFDIRNNFKASVDPYPLDNQEGAVLAHAFFPRDGNLHWDIAEKWTEGTDDGINLRIVTAHEMGHAIGLHHSNDGKALMAPWYAGYIAHDKYVLPDDDAKGSQALYGRRGYYKSVAKKADSSAAKTQFCEAKKFIAAFTFTDGNAYIVTDNGKAFQLKDGKLNEKFEPVSVSKDLTDINAGFFNANRKTLVLLKGDKIFVAKGDDLSNIKTSEVKVAKGTLNGNKITAAYAHVGCKSKVIKRFWAIEGNKLISGLMLNKKDETAVFSRRSIPMSKLFKMGNGKNLPESVDAAVLAGKADKQRLYLFNGNSLYVAKQAGKRSAKYMIPSNYPVPIKQHFGC